MHTATADPLGPYCTGASIPAGNVLRCARPQAQVPLTMRYSMTLRWITTSTTWRRSAGTVAAIPVPQRPQAQVPVNGMITHWSG